MPEEVLRIPTEKLLPNPYQPRKHFKSEDLLSLADSIKENGVLQPLLARRINNAGCVLLFLQICRLFLVL